MNIDKVVAAIGVCVLLSGCTVAPPDDTKNICKIFAQYPKWYWATQEVQQKYGVPIPVQMAIIYQESRFKAKAKPPRDKLLGFIPWFRPTSAYGYTQALDVTWEHYQARTGHEGASRKNFADAVDFVGWYVNDANRICGISKSNTYALYLAYHEGLGGYKRKTYLKRSWLIPVARKVARQSRLYQQQLRQCQASLPKKHWWNSLFG